MILTYLQVFHIHRIHRLDSRSFDQLYPMSENYSLFMEKMTIDLIYDAV